MSILLKDFKELRKKVTGVSHSLSDLELIRYFKNAVKAEEKILHSIHKMGTGGKRLVHFHTRFIDDIIKTLFAVSLKNAADKSKSVKSGLSVAALGGYGRGELNPKSDIDILFVYQKRLTKEQEQVITKMLYFFWDIGFDIGHSSRSVYACIRMAKENIDSATAMMESRYICGDKETFTEYHKKVLDFLRRSRGRKYLSEKTDEQTYRYKFYDYSLYVQEPNIKESSGGLRDIHLIRWFSKVLFDCFELSCLYKDGLYTIDDVKPLERAYDFLLRLRNELHFLYQSRKDLLTFYDQPVVAKNLGYVSSVSLKAEARLMRDYYKHARTVSLFKQDFVERCIESMSRKKKKVRQIDKDFTLINSNTLEMCQPEKSFADNPEYILRAFYYQQKYRCRISNDLKAKIRKEGKTLSESFRRDTVVNKLFLSILSKKSYVEPVLRTMHELGVLGRLVPEFGRINYFVYYDNFHRYTADEHTLLTLRSLDDLLTAKEHTLKELSDMLHTIPHIHILRLALLLHDLGKVYGPYHSKKSAEMVPRISRKMGLDGDQISLIEFLVRNHIVMSNFIQTRDLNDDDSIGEFANIAATPKRLSMLYILTYCDIHAVAPNVWSDWKHSLLWNLFRKTLNYITLEEFAEKRVEYFSALREDIINECSDEFSLDEIEEHLNNIHEKYIFTTSPSIVKIHLRLIREAKNNTFAINVVRKEKTGLTEFTFCSTIDKIGLLSEIMGTLTLQGLNILSAKVFTRSDGIALDRIIIVGIVEDALWERVNDNLKKTLIGNESIDAQVRGYRKFLKITGKKKLTIQTKVTFNNKTSQKFTIIEIETQDRIGLLYLITRALSDLSLNIAFAKIFTEGDKALDVFYVTDEKKNKISSKRKLEKIKKTLSDVLSMQFNKN